MTFSNSGGGIQFDAAAIVAGLVQSVNSDGSIIVMLHGGRVLSCSLLHPIGAPAMTPPVECPVLVWTNTVDDCGIVLGALEPTTAHERHQPVVDELLIEARESLILKVGDGSITIRADGKILIKGKDLVSQAKNTNRIKGGAVAIN